ncbi:MAG TPA: PHP domain-containing protein [Thermodesulfobacteriota bacterium]|nr:PHP domain-containing protein [Thermodesulfobacteriota bacterium]
MLKPFLADLHVHTVLSGCAEVEMIPPLILQQAKRLGLSLIAITDHNSCHNAEAVMEASVGTGVHVLPGMELQSKEEVHLLCLFDTIRQCQEWQEEVFQRLPARGNKEEIFGAQFVVNAAGEWVRTEERFLAGAADMGLEEAVARVHAMGGMVIPAHVDRPSFSLLSNLGWVPESLQVQALEVTPQFVPEIGFQKWPQLKAWCLVVNGDAHRLQEMQSRTLFKIDAPVVHEIHLALQGEQGRRVMVEWPGMH